MRIKKYAAAVMAVCLFISSMVCVAADREQMLTKFSFEHLNYTDDSLNVTYGGSADDGYAATNGVLKDGAVLYASVNGVDKKKIEWSNYEGADGNDYKDSDGNVIGAVPVMAAGSKHTWGDAMAAPPYFEIVTSTLGYNNITFSAELGGSKKGAASFAMAYSLNGVGFTDVATYTISANKTMEKAFENVALPAVAANAQNLYIRIYPTANTTIGGGVLSDNPSGGETAINNICFKGISISGKAVWQPDFDVLYAKLENDLLSIGVKNVSISDVSATSIVALYNGDSLVKVFVAELDELSENSKYLAEYSTAELEFDNVRVFNWSGSSDIKPLSTEKRYEKADIEYIPTPEPTEEPYSNEPAYQDIPVVEITGDITDISRENYKDVVLTYKSATEEFTSYASIKWQGRSSVTQGYPKYNYSLKMYSDEGRSEKLTKQFKTWLPAYNYCLKANWIDSTHARNIVNARLGAIIQKNPLPTGSTGLVDGFPIHVYLNGVDQGIYTWNIPKKGWTFNMDSDNPNHIVFGAEQQTGACLFETESVSDRDWELVYPDASDTARDKFNRLITFVKDSTVDEFRASFDQYLDFDSMANYYVLSHIMAHTDGYAKNMLMATFDGNVWYPSLYDMDSTWGLHWRGRSIISEKVLCDPTCGDGAMYNTSQLWNKFEQAFGNEIYQRYTEVKEILTDERIIEEYQYFIDGVGQELYDLDESVWEGVNSSHPYIPSRNYRLDQIKTYMEARKPYVDAWMEGLRSE